MTSSSLPCLSKLHSHSSHHRTSRFLLLSLLTAQLLALAAFKLWPPSPSPSPFSLSSPSSSSSSSHLAISSKIPLASTKNGLEKPISTPTGSSNSLSKPTGSPATSSYRLSRPFSTPTGSSNSLSKPTGSSSSYGLSKPVVAISSSSSGLNKLSSAECPLGRIFVYSLPPQFNIDLVANCSVLSPWVNVCPFMTHGGLGERIETAGGDSSSSSYFDSDSWYVTDQFAAEVIYHTRMLAHECRTDDPWSASAFYVPFYTGLEVGRHLWGEANLDARVKDKMAAELLDWLSLQPSWQQRGGTDHFFMVGRITWDFRRTLDRDWGSSFFNMPLIQNVTRLLIERNPWDNREMGVPYPTNFHPRSAEHLEKWQAHLRTTKRVSLFTFAGAPRKQFPNDFRRTLLDQCHQLGDPLCRTLDCSGTKCSGGGGSPQAAIRLFLNSTFCLQPRGDSFTRRSIFDCMLAGAIPVFFWHRTAYWQYKWHLPEDGQSYSVFIPKSDIRNGTRVEDVLKALPEDEIIQMRENVIRLIPRVIYAASGGSLGRNNKDAFDISVEGMLRRIQASNLGSQAM